ncbi:MAG: hypothetical protein IH899_08755, partial [Planctomycetes bacterium]|nr:hypothetical protein [Planctomycetota bacterium]
QKARQRQQPETEQTEQDDEASCEADDSTEQKNDGAAGRFDKDQFRELVDKANEGDDEALTQMRKVLDGHPMIWEQVGDLAAHARLTLIRMISGSDKLLFESLTRKALEMEAELLGQSPSLMERLAVERVVSCWMQMQHADTKSVAAAENLAQARYWSQRQDQAHRRYTAALKQLTTIRQFVPSNAQASAEPVEHAQPSAESMDNAKQVKPAAEPGTTKGDDHKHSDPPTKAAATQDTDTDRAASGNGEAPHQVPEVSEGNHRTNGQPVNRILRFADLVEKT